ncbi:MAG: ATP cone domain-containing protein, partial [Aeromonas veronii]
MKPVVIKRDGCRAPFNAQLIAEAVSRAAEAVNQANPALALRISSAVSQELEGRGEVDIHEIQNRVENHLMASDDKAIARAYIEYRHDRDQAREARGRLAQEIRGLVEQTN